MFKTFRILVLLLILLAVGLGAMRARARIAEWKYTVRAVVYPIVGDDSEATRRYAAGLAQETFEPVATFLNDEAASFDVGAEFGRSVEIELAPEVRALPPEPPIDGGLLSIMWWSLALRYWAWTVDTYEGLPPQSRLFVVYFDPKETETLDHSVGIQKGAIGLVKAFASDTMAGTNNVVIAHELLHTFGASDKYDPETTQPRFPEGYARPEAQPLHPQRFAEIMGGRIPISESVSELPRSLNETLVGSDTAREISWIP